MPPTPTSLVAGTQAPPQPQQPSPGPDPLWGALALVVLAVAALFLARRRVQRVRRMEVIESLGLGPRRSLCLARVDGRVLILGVSEAGVQLLSSHDEPAWAAITEAQVAELPAPSPPPRDEAVGFEQLLVESADEQDLRARLQAARLRGGA